MQPDVESALLALKPVCSGLAADGYALEVSRTDSGGLVVGDRGRTRRLRGVSDSQGDVRWHAFVPTELGGDGVLGSDPGLSSRLIH